MIKPVLNPKPLSAESRLHADTDQSPLHQQRMVSGLIALILASLAGWWVASIRANGGLLLPYVRPDILVVSFLCMIPLAMLFVESLCLITRPRRPRFFRCLQGLFYCGTTGLLVYAVTFDPASATFGQGMAWEAFFLRPAIACWLMVTILLLARSLWPWHRNESSTVHAQTAGLWLLAFVIALLVPAFYVQSRADEMVTKTEEYLGSGRLGEARQLTREIGILSPWQTVSNLPVDDLLRDLDRDCYEIERNLAFMERRPVNTEEFHFQKARLLSILGNTSAAVSELKPWTEQAGASPLSFQLLGNIYQQAENWENSQRFYQRALKAWEAFPRSEQQQEGLLASWKGIAFAERKRGNYAEAEAAYLSALSLVPTADQHFLLAQFYEDTQQSTKAKDHAEQAMALNASRYAVPGQKIMTSIQQQHFGCLGAWRNGRP